MLLIQRKRNLRLCSSAHVGQTWSCSVVLVIRLAALIIRHLPSTGPRGRQSRWLHRLITMEHTAPLTTVLVTFLVLLLTAPITASAIIIAKILMEHGVC